MSTDFNLRGRMTLTLHGARNLSNCVFTMGQLNPFADVKLSNSKNQKFKTRVCKNGDKTPSWEQSFIFSLEGTEQILHCNVWHDGSITNDHIGRCDVQLNLLDLSGERRWYGLRKKDNFQRQTGELCMSITFDGHGLPEHSQAYETHHKRTSATITAPSAPVQYQQQAPPPQYQSAPDTTPQHAIEVPHYHQHPAQPYLYQAPPIYQTMPPPAVYQTIAPPQVVYQQMYSAASDGAYSPVTTLPPIIGFWPNGQPRFLGQ